MAYTVTESLKILMWKIQWRRKIFYKVFACLLQDVLSVISTEVDQLTLSFSLLTPSSLVVDLPSSVTGGVLGSAQVSLRRDRAFSSPLILSRVGGDADDTGWSVYTETIGKAILLL